MYWWLHQLLRRPRNRRRLIPTQMRHKKKTQHHVLRQRTTTPMAHRPLSLPRRQIQTATALNRRPAHLPQAPHPLRHHRAHQ